MLCYFINKKVPVESLNIADETLTRFSRMPTPAQEEVKVLVKAPFNLFKSYKIKGQAENRPFYHADPLATKLCICCTVDRVGT